MWRSDYGVLISVGPDSHSAGDPEEIEQNPFFCPDPDKVPEMEEYMAKLNKEGNSIGAKSR